MDTRSVISPPSGNSSQRLSPRGGVRGRGRAGGARDARECACRQLPQRRPCERNANAGTHNHRRMLWGRLEPPPSKNNLILWLWVLAGACHRAAQRADPVARTTERVAHRQVDFARRANVPHPDEHCLNPQIRTIIHVIPHSQEGRFAIVTNVGSGMRWTRRVSRRMTMSRTAKSYGPGAPTLASTWR